MIKILICDDQEIVCEGLQRILSAEADFSVIGIAHDGQTALDMVEKDPPDLVLMDLKMPIMNGILATRKLRSLYPKIQVLVLTTYADDEWLFDAIRSGAAGYLLKDRPRNELIAAVRGTVEGNAYIDPAVARKVLTNVAQSSVTPSQEPQVNLTPREEEILELLVLGFSNPEIAQRLFLSEGTVRNYLSALFTKLGVSDRTQAVLVALRYGLVNLNG